MPLHHYAHTLNQLVKYINWQILQNDTLKNDDEDKTDKELKKEKSRKAFYKEFQKVCASFISEIAKLCYINFSGVTISPNIFKLKRKSGIFVCAFFSYFSSVKIKVWFRIRFMVS